ncbi:hypothetical protein [Qaidamihabitans albus]|uniref:hypothetical protein n=1 Tax=Qaidamihabitans albus TaxID=2795733 RepID=UPI0018F133A3|nr:hypothetical protein [Qaidamihabitans albus]
MLAAALLAATAVAVMHLERFQRIEAHISALSLAVVMFSDAHVPAGTEMVVFKLTDGQLMGIRIAAQHATPLLALPLVLATIPIVALRPTAGGRGFAALASAVGTLVVANQLRVLLTGLLADNAPPRYRHNIGATVFSSMSTVICMAAAILLFVLVFIKTRPASTARQSGEAT